MESKQIISMLMDIETRFPINGWRMHGINIWPLLRIAIEESFWATGNTHQITPLQEYMNDTNIKDTDWLNHRIDVVFLTTNLAKTFVGDKWYDRHCDPIVDMLQDGQRQVLVLETEADKRIRQPRHSCAIPIQRYLDEYAKKYSFIEESFELKGYQEFITYICDKHKVKYQVVDPISISAKIQRIRNKADFFKMVFSKTKPKTGFVVNYYSENGLAFNLACREFGIPSVDIQHGVQGDYHSAYGSWRNFPEGGYALLPSYFWVWTEREEKAIKQWGGLSHQPLVLGNLWLEYWKDNNALTNRYDSAIQHSFRFDDSVRILVTLQPQYGLPGWDNNLPDWFIHAVKHSPDHWEWWFRLHPQMYKGRYDDEAQNLISILQQSQLLDKVEIDRSTQLPLYALLRHCDVHVTGHSSSVIEADQFGIPSIVTHINGAHYYQDQINHGLIVTAFTESELLGAIRSLCNHKRTTNRKTELGFYQQIKHTAAETIEALMQGAQTDNHIHVDDEEDVYIELLGINSCFEQIIHDFGNSRDVNRQMAVAKSYYQLGNMEQATRLYQECIDNIKSNNYNKVLSIPAIIELLGIYPNLAPNYQVKIAEMIRTTTENEVEIGLLLKELFRRDQHDWITRLASWHRDTCAVDVLFYTGRSYKSMGNYTESIRYLNDFTQILKNSKQAMGHTNSKSYLLSAYFHLGECFLLLLQNDKAIGAFQHCFELSDHTHNKAKAYIDQLMMQKI